MVVFNILKTMPNFGTILQRYIGHYTTMVLEIQYTSVVSEIKTAGVGFLSISVMTDIMTVNYD